jgi:hypothetical protein
LQAGGHRFDPDQLHQKTFIRCFPIAAIVFKLAPIWEQAGMFDPVQQVSGAPGLAFLGEREGNDV